MIHDSWQLVTVETINNCFQNAFNQTSSKFSQSSENIEYGELKESVNIFGHVGDINDVINADDDPLHETGGHKDITSAHLETKSSIINEETEEVKMEKVLIEEGLKSVQRPRNFTPQRGKTKKVELKSIIGLENKTHGIKKGVSKPTTLFDRGFTIKRRFLFNFRF